MSECSSIEISPDSRRNLEAGKCRQDEPTDGKYPSYVEHFVGKCSPKPPYLHRPEESTKGTAKAEIGIEGHPLFGFYRVINHEAALWVVETVFPEKEVLA